MEPALADVDAVMDGLREAHEVVAALDGATAMSHEMVQRIGQVLHAAGLSVPPAAPDGSFRRRRCDALRGMETDGVPLDEQFKRYCVPDLTVQREEGAGGSVTYTLRVVLVKVGDGRVSACIARHRGRCWLILHADVSST